MALRILSFHAHPDDAEILLGGSLALLAHSGHAITIATMTPGDKGSAELEPDAIAAIRREEARQAAAVIGARYLCAEFPDLEIFNDAPSRRRVVELLRQEKPDVVITAAPVDYLCDHEMTSLLVRDACFAAGLRNYATDSPALPAIPHLYFMDPIEGQDREGRMVKPDFIVDITATFETKRRMLACHDSQRQWLRRMHGLDDYLNSMEHWTRQRGAEGGVRFGEGLRQYRGHPYPATPLLQEQLPLCGAARDA
jgi:LmbE family N-acetylglucosaminyl deacetylase